MIRRLAPVAELVDAADSKSVGGDIVLVRVRPGAPPHSFQRRPMVGDGKFLPGWTVPRFNRPGEHYSAMEFSIDTVVGLPGDNTPCRNDASHVLAPPPSFSSTRVQVPRLSCSHQSKRLAARMPTKAPPVRGARSQRFSLLGITVCWRTSAQSMGRTTLN